MMKQRKNKKGFTLVEMILSIAIICLLGGTIAGVCASISSSFGTTYNIDDSVDYAMLYGKGFENSFLSYTQGAGTTSNTWTWYISDPKSHETSVPTLRCTLPDGTKTSVFEPKFIGNSATDYKWDIRMFYKFDEATATVKYNVFLKDNFSKTHYVYVYQGSFWVPQFEKRAEFAGVTDSREIKLSGLPMTEDTFKTYGYTTDELENVKIFYDKTYQSTISYKWG